MSRHIFLMLIFSAYFFIFGNWVLSITSPDEGKNLDAALRMLETGDFIVPKYNCEHRFEKPPMFYWLTDVSFSLFGVNEFSGRLVSGLAAAGLSFLTFLFTLETFGSKMAFFSSLVYMTLIHNWVESRAATPEMLLTFFMTLGLYLFVKGRFTLGWTALALAFLTKGPVGVILPAGVYLLWKRDLRFLNFKGIVIFLAVGSSWYLVMLWKFGFTYFYKFFLYENIMRYTGHKRIQPYPFWYYIPVIAASSILYLPKLPQIVRNWDRKLNPYLLWFFFVLIFYSLAKNKLHHYILFLYPPLAIMLGRYVGRGYMVALLLISSLLLGGTFFYAKKIEKERFVPGAADTVREFKGKVYFYRTENSAIVFYSRRCIEKVSDPEKIDLPALVITESKHIKDLPGGTQILQGNEFGKKLVLIELK